MTTRLEAAEARLAEVLAAPVQLRSPEVRELAEQRAQHGPPDDVVTKSVAVAATPETDTTTGTFTALVSDYLTDREGDRFVPGAWTKAIAKIRRAGKPLPLLFGHDTRSVNSVIGLVQPDNVWADERGLWIRGWLDTGDSLGARLHRMVQKGVLTWSVGFSLARKRRGSDGVNELVEVEELYEVSATPLPANPRTGTAGLKSVDPDDIPSLEELAARERELGLHVDPDLEQVKAEWRAQILAVMGADDDGTLPATETLKAKAAPAARLEREHAPVQIASFEC